MTKTFKEFEELDKIVASIFIKNEKLRGSKFGYTWNRLCQKNYFSVAKEFNEKLADIRIEYALEDEKTKEILIDKLNPRAYKYSKDGLKNCVKAERDMIKEFDSKEIEYEPYFCTSLPEEITSLPEEIFNMFVGLIIKNNK